MNNRVGHIILASLGTTNAALGIAAELGNSQTYDSQRSQASAGDRGDELVSLQAQWLKVPQRCKDRSVSSDPVRVKGETLTAAAAAIHAQIGMTVV